MPEKLFHELFGERNEMAIEFLLPDLGEGIHEAEIQSVMVKEGDMVERRPTDLRSSKLTKQLYKSLLQ